MAPAWPIFLPAGAVTPALYWDTQDPYHYVRVQRTSNTALGGDNDEAVDVLTAVGWTRQRLEDSVARMRELLKLERPSDLRFDAVVRQGRADAAAAEQVASRVVPGSTAP